MKNKGNKTMKKIVALLLSVVLLCSAAACSTREVSETIPEVPETTATPTTPTPTPTAEPTIPPVIETEKPVPTVTPEPVVPTPTPEPEPAYYDLFTGEGREEPNTVRPFAVMINNLKQAQPQCGIGEADIIFEALAEGGVTRMMAIFSDIRNVAHLGSIRSIRPYYIDISLAFGAVTCHAGGSDDAYARIKKDKIENIDGVRGNYPITVFYRDQERKYSGYAVEHTLFTEGEDLYKCAEQLKYDLTLPEGYQTGMHFVKDGTPENGSAASNIEVVFNVGKSTQLAYHDDSGMYTASQHGGSYNDGNTDTPVTFRNVIGIYAPSKVLDNYGRLAVNLFGSGNGYFACGGQYIEITWTRENVDDCFHYYLADGSELNFGTGTTYIAVLAENESTMSFS